MHDSYTPYYSGDLIHDDDAGGHVVRTGENKHKYRVLMWKSGRKRPRGRPRRRWVNVKMDLK